MKITPKQYGLSLYQAILNKKSGQIKVAIENFVRLLINNNDISKADEIIKQFEKIWNKEKGIVKAEIVSAKKLSNVIVKSLNKYITKLSGAKKVELNQKIEKDVLGGVVIKYEDKVMDGSMKTRLKELKSKMVK